MAGGVCIGFGAIFVVIGVCLAVIGGLFLSPELGKMERGLINRNIIVDSKKSTGYDDWAGGYDVKTDYQMVFYFFNLTNMEAVRKGAKPIYNEIGPYIYRRHRRSVNVSFDDGGKLLRYANFKDYTFQRNLSVGNDSDVFVNLNPVYLGALAQTQNELGMLTALSPAYTQEAIDFLTGRFIPLFSIYKSPPSLAQKLNETIEAIGGDSDAAMVTFLGIWANSTEYPTNTPGNWTSMMISEPSKVASGISLESAQMMFDPLDPYSLFSTDAEVAWEWSIAMNKSNTPLTNHFSLTTAQLQDVLLWRTNVYAPTYIHPDYINAYELGDITDLGWLQWYDGTPLDGSSINDIWSELANPLGVGWEFFTAGDNTFTSWEFSKRVMDSEHGLRNVYVFQDWLTAETGGATDFSQWNLTQDQSDSFFTYSFQIGNGYGGPTLQGFYGDSGGLFRAKTVLQWVFDCEDYILPILQPDALPCGILVNHTAYPRSTIWTGKGDVKKINTYVEWREMTNITNLWAGPLKVEGHTALGQFQPNLKGTPNETLTVFDINLVRPVELRYNNTVEIKGIQTNRYLVDWQKLFAPSDFYYQSVFGLANLTGFQQGSPIFLSNWDMVGVEHRADWVDGLNLNSTEFEWNTVLDVEPKTGNTVQAYQKLQVNMYLPPSANSYFQFSPFKNNPRVGMAYPLAKAGEYVIVSEDLAKKLRDSLKAIHGVKKVGFWVCVTVGPVLLLLGVAMIVIGHRRRTRAAYELIN